MCPHGPIAAGPRPTWTCLAAFVLLAACAAPVRVRHADPEWVQRDLTRSVLTGSEVSGPTHYELHRWGLEEQYRERPEDVLAEVHRHIVGGDDSPGVVFAAAELSFHHAERTKNPAHFLASGVYAWAFLFPGKAERVPHRFDPRVRIAADLYNRAFTRGLYAPDGRHVSLASGVHPLPFGALEIALAPEALVWGERRLVDFLPAAELEVKGLAQRYRRAGLGVPLAAATRPRDASKEPDDFIGPRIFGCVSHGPSGRAVRNPRPRGPATLPVGGVRAPVVREGATMRASSIDGPNGGRVSEGIVRLTHVMYALHTFSAAMGIVSSAAVVTAFLTGWPSILAVILNYAKRGDARGTWVASHFRWQIRTFWFALLWLVVAALLLVTIVGIPFAWLVVVVTGVWVLYRMARGWLALMDGRPVAE